jgi:hypothetical protein
LFHNHLHRTFPQKSGTFEETYIFQTLSLCPVLAVMSRVTCQADESRLTCLCGPVADVLSRLPCHGCPAKLSHLSCPCPSCTEPYSHVLVISSLDSPRCIMPTVLSCFYVLAILSRLYCPGCCVLAVLSRLYCPGCSVLAVLSQLSCPSTLHIPSSRLATALSLLSCPCRPVQSVLSGRPVYTDSSRYHAPVCSVADVLSRLSFFAVLSSLSHPSFPVLAVVSRHSCPPCLVPTLLFQLSSAPALLSLAFLFPLFCPYRRVLAIMSTLSCQRLTCLGRPNKWVC